MSPATIPSSTTVLGNGGDSPAAKGPPPSFTFGAGGSGGGDRRPKRPLPHIDDITSANIDLDSYAHAPIDKVLTTGEEFLRQAETSRSFGRPDLALRDYIQATIIVVDVIKKNKDWVSLQSGNKTLSERYLRLMRQVNASHNIYEKIKADIKADNVRTGVQPSVHRPGTINPAVASRAKANPSTEHGENGTGNATDGRQGRDRAKPAVHPKPQALHGNTVRPDGGNLPTRKAVQDLAERFSQLRAATGSPAQDPRIRTQPIMARPVGGREDASPSPRTSFVGENVLPDLPKMPDAIYSPARGTVSSEAAELPSSTPRGIFSRTNSTAAVPNGSSAMKSPPPDDYFASHSPEPTGLPAKRTKLTFPEGDTLSAQGLVELMRSGSKDISILLIDIRSRSEFDDGHIMSQATICVESEVLVRENISANEIADSMILAPSAEQLHFERRHDFDLVVFYDQDSTQISWRTDTPSQRAISGLYNALSHYDFARDSVTRRPKLLEGGLDAWTNLMGEVSLQTSSTTMRARPWASTSSVGRAPIQRLKPRQKFVARPIQDADEARRWEETLNNVESFSPVRTTGDFLRRFPPVSTIQESMVAPVTAAVRTEAGAFGYGSSRQEDLFPSWPAPPQRPAPTVPRPSYSGLAETDNRGELMRVLKTTSKADGDGEVRQFVGLVNPRNWCYGNSSLQSLFGTSGFADDLRTGDWQDKYKVPIKAGEKIQPPQLLTKMLANLFDWMAKGKFRAMEARTLMEYLRHIHGKNIDGTAKEAEEVFGGDYQQDAQEYFSFIIDQLHDETNRLRDKTERLTNYRDNDTRSLLQNSIEYWKAYSELHDSIVDKYWRGLLVLANSCPACGDSSMSFQISDMTPLAITKQDRSLESMLATYTALSAPPDYVCQKCKKKGCRQTKLDFARVPDRLAVTFQRFQSNPRTGVMTKLAHEVSFPIQDLDLGPYCIDGKDRAIQDDKEAETVAKTDRHFSGPFVYDCYAVICHVGASLTAGHYIAYVKDGSSKDPTDWVKFNDTLVTQVKAGTGKPGDELQKMYKDGTQQAYMVFYKRRGT